MILHTIVNNEDIFYKSPPVFTERKIGDVRFYGTDTKDGFRAVRMITTNLDDYLKYGSAVGNILPANRLLLKRDGVKQHDTDKTKARRKDDEKTSG